LVLNQFIDIYTLLIFFEAVKRLKPDWKNIDLHLWRVYARTHDKIREQEYAAKVGLGSLSLEKRLATAKKANLQYLMVNNIGWQNWLNLNLADLQIERTSAKGIKDFWGQTDIFAALTQSEVDRELSEKIPQKIDNPAYLLHVNPYSITYLVFGTIFKSYWDAIKPEGEPEFIVNSFEFTPRSVSLLYLNPCWDNNSNCKFQSYSKDVSDYIVLSRTLHIAQFDSNTSPIPFK
jgi:hypothetical protein